MENSTYATLTRQTGLVREMQVVANNIANAATTGFRQEGLVFSEFVQSIAEHDSLSMARANTRDTSMDQGALNQTNGPFDLAIEGDGFFLVETPGGERLTRSGSFTPNAAGDLVTNDGFLVLDAGGAPVFVPPGATDIRIAPDGTISSEGQPFGQVGLYQAVDQLGLIREDGVMFRSENGVEAAPDARIMQGFLEASNVNAVSQITRMIEVQRAYELGQNFLENEDERIRKALNSLMKSN